MKQQKKAPCSDLPKKRARKKTHLPFKSRESKKEKKPCYVATCLVCGKSIAQTEMTKKRCKHLRFNLNVDQVTHVETCTDAWVCKTCLGTRLCDISCKKCGKEMFDAGIASRCRECFNEDDAYKALEWGGLEKSVQSLMESDKSPFETKKNGRPSYAQLADSWEASWRIVTLLQVNLPLIERYEAQAKK